MTVSVIIPLYNKVKHIQRAIESVLVQSFSDFEVIVVDDGSTDGSGDVVAAIADPRIRLIVQTNAGECATRNRGIAEAKTDWVAFLDSDDEWMPRFLECVAGLIATHHSLVAVFTNIISFRDNEPWLTCPFSEPRVLENYFAFSVLNNGRGMTSSSIVVRRQSLEAVGGFPVGIHRGGDSDTWVRLALKGEVGYVPLTLAVYHNEVAGSGAMFPQPRFPESVTTLRRLRDENGIPPHLAKSIRIFENLLLLQYAKELTDSCDWSAAMHILYHECQIRNCPKKHLFIVQCRLLLRWLLQGSDRRTQPTDRNKVMFLANIGGPYGGNFVASAMLLQRTCRDMGGELHLVLPARAQPKPWAQSLVAGGASVSFIPDRGTLFVLFAILSLIRQNRVNVIHTHFTRYDVTAWVAARIAGLFRSSRIALIWHIHSDFPVKDGIVRRLKDYLKFRLMGRSAHILVVSGHLAERPIAAGFSRRRLHTIKNGIDFTRLDAKKSSMDPLPQTRSKKENTVLMFGWHPFIKGVDVALQAFERVAGQRDDVALVIVGGKQTRAEVLERYPQGNPSWLSLVSPIESVVEYFAHAGVFLSASRREGFSYSVSEALACECMVVASDIPALEWMKGAIHYWCFSNENPIALAERLIECVSMPEDKRRSVAKENAEYIRKHLAAETWVAEVIEAYRHIAAQEEQRA